MVREISNLLQVFDSCMYQVPLVYPCTRKKGGTGAFFIYTALYQLTKPVICSQSTCVTLSLPAWCRRWRQGQARSLSQGYSCSVQVRQPQHEICPWNKSAARDEVSAESERNPVCMSSQLLLLFLPCLERCLKTTQKKKSLL